jgi:phosphatidylinositol alpha-1,6-mannosyltransferase
MLLPPVRSVTAIGRLIVVTPDGRLYVALWRGPCGRLDHAIWLCGTAAVVGSTASMWLCGTAAVAASTASMWPCGTAAVAASTASMWPCDAYPVASPSTPAHGPAVASRLPARTPRLLLLTPDFPPAHGGIQVLSHRLAAGFADFDTRVVALDSPGAADFDAGSGVATRRVPPGRLTGRGAAMRQLALNAHALREAARFAPHATLSMHIVTSPAATALRRVRGIPSVQYFHANEIPNHPRLTAFAARHADATIAVSAYTASLIRAAAGPTYDARIALIAPGVELPGERDDRASEPRGSPMPRATRPTVLTIARLTDSYKGHDVLLDALVRVRAQVPEIEWIVIGDGPLRAGLEQRARALGLADAVRFLGRVSDEQRDRWLRHADVFAMPSRLPENGLAGEGFGIVYLEAAAHGMPVLAGNVAGALDAVLDGETGILVDPTDALAVAAALTKLLGDRALAQRLGAAGAQRAREFAWPRIAAHVEALLLEQIALSPRSRRLARRRRGVKIS